MLSRYSKKKTLRFSVFDSEQGDTPQILWLAKVCSTVGGFDGLGFGDHVFINLAAGLARQSSKGDSNFRRMVCLSL